MALKNAAIAVGERVKVFDAPPLGVTRLSLYINNLSTLDNLYLKSQDEEKADKHTIRRNSSKSFTSYLVRQDFDKGACTFRLSFVSEWPGAVYLENPAGNSGAVNYEAQEVLSSG